MVVGPPTTPGLDGNGRPPGRNGGRGTMPPRRNGWAAPGRPAPPASDRIIWRYIPGAYVRAARVTAARATATGLTPGRGRARAALRAADAARPTTRRAPSYSACTCGIASSSSSKRPLAIEPSLLPIAVPIPGATIDPRAPPTTGRAFLATPLRTPPRARPTGDLTNDPTLWPT